MTEPKRLVLPLSEAAVRGLALGDAVVLDGEIVVAAGLPTHRRLLEHVEAGTAPPIDLAGAALFHLGSYSRQTDGRFEILYMNPTTSTRFNGFMPTLIRRFGLRAVGGKGGLDAECARAMAEVGCAYLSFLGGGAQLHSAAIREVVEVAWDDLIPHYRLVRLRVAGLGPLTVAIDAHGNNRYEQLGEAARARLPQILAELAAERQATAVRK
jgi:fumarate hydratase subunit beta